MATELGSGRLSPGGHGTIIDFVQQELGLPRGRGLPSLGLALKEIRDFVGIVRATQPAPRRPDRPGDAPEARREPGPEVQQRWNAAQRGAGSGVPGQPGTHGGHAVPRAVQRVPGGSMAATTCCSLIGTATGAWSGFEIKNHGFTSYPHGGVRTGMWRSNPLPADRYYLLTESAINALSFHQLHPEMPTAHRSFGGRIGTAQLRLLASELERLAKTTTVLLAFDGAGDPTGPRYEEQVRRILPEDLRAEIAHPPHGKDWNEYLQSLESQPLTCCRRRPPAGEATASHAADLRVSSSRPASSWASGRRPGQRSSGPERSAASWEESCVRPPDGPGVALDPWAVPWPTCRHLGAWPAPKLRPAYPASLEGNKGGKLPGVMAPLEK